MLDDLTAVVLAAGEGTRLRPLTADRPKPMVLLGGRPALDYVFGWLQSFGVENISVNLHYRPETIIDYFGDGSRYGLRVNYSYEPKILGTAGGVARLKTNLSGTFLVCYGDVLTDIDLNQLVARHRETGAVATLALYDVPDPWTRGVVDVDERGRVIGFREKPPRETCQNARVNAGIYVLEPTAIRSVTPGEFSDFGHDVFPRLLADGARIYAWPANAYVLDYGTVEQYRRADEDVRRGALKLWPLRSAMDSP